MSLDDDPKLLLTRNRLNVMLERVPQESRVKEKRLRVTITFIVRKKKLVEFAVKA